MCNSVFWCTLVGMRKKKYRKVYELVNPVQFAIEGAAVTDQQTLDKLRAMELTSIEAFRTGSATIEDWKKMADICNVTESMAKAGIGPEAMDAVRRGHEALLDAHRRYVETNRMGTTAQGLTAFRDVYEYHDLQRQSVARSVYERHIGLVVNKIRSNAPDVVRVKG